MSCVLDYLFDTRDPERSLIHRRLSRRCVESKRLVLLFIGAFHRLIFDLFGCDDRDSMPY
jgi:hypothetical protein